MIDRALFVDRDGVLNQVVMRGEIIGSPRNWNEFHWTPGLEDLSRIKVLGFRLILISNQPDIERGLMSQDFLEQVNEQLQSRFQFDAIYVCPFSSNSHPWKKPNPGLFQRAAQQFGLNLERCFHLGDTFKDVEAALNAKCHPVIWDQPHNQEIAAAHRVRNLSELERILSREA